MIAIYVIVGLVVLNIVVFGALALNDRLERRKKK